MAEYCQQAGSSVKLQFCSQVLGNSDLLGSPLKLKAHVMDGVSDLRKGMEARSLKGVGKGVVSLGTNVVAGGLGTVGKITGSFGAVLKGAARPRSVLGSWGNTMRGAVINKER